MILRPRFFGIGFLALTLVFQQVGFAQETTRDTAIEKAVQVAQATTIPVPVELPFISLDFKDVEIQAVLQALARKGKVNIVTGKDVTGTITIHLTDVTWEQALDAVTKMSSFGYEKDGNVILVSTLEDLKARREAMKELVEIEPLTTKVIELRFLDAGDAKKFLEPQLSPQGRISVLEVTGQKGWVFGAAAVGGEGGGQQKARERRKREGSRSKAIVITDTPTTIERLERILTKIDVMPRQVLIETRVMEVSRDLLRDLGLEAGTGNSSTNLSSSSGFVSSTTSRTFTDQALSQIDGVDNKASFGGSVLNQFLTPSIFVPETTSLTAANTGLSFILRRIRGTQFEVLMRALEEDVRTNTLSAPHVLTLSGQEARVLVGEKYPILNTQVSGTSTSVTTTTLDYYQDIGVELFVVPQVGGDDHIDMIIHPVVSSRTGTVGSNAYPILSTREAETQIIIENGDTIVIGGLLKDVLSKSRIGLPFLGKIPILGFLFSRSTTDVEKIDLLIFITARIVESQAVSPEEMERLRKDYEKAVREQTPLEAGRSWSDLTALPTLPKKSSKPTPPAAPSSATTTASPPAAKPATTVSTAPTATPPSAASTSGGTTKATTPGAASSTASPTTGAKPTVTSPTMSASSTSSSTQTPTKSTTATSTTGSSSSQASGQTR